MLLLLLLLLLLARKRGRSIIIEKILVETELSHRGREIRGLLERRGTESARFKRLTRHVLCRIHVIRGTIGFVHVALLERARVERRWLRVERMNKLRYIMTLWMMLMLRLGLEVLGIMAKILIVRGGRRDW